VKALTLAVLLAATSGCASTIPQTVYDSLAASIAATRSAWVALCTDKAEGESAACDASYGPLKVAVDEYTKFNEELKK